MQLVTFVRKHKAQNQFIISLRLRGTCIQPTSCYYGNHDALRLNVTAGTIVLATVIQKKM